MLQNLALGHRDSAAIVSERRIAVLRLLDLYDFPFCNGLAGWSSCL